uniref:L1 transposable element RRM domain-containing protein n=1 Tax=Oryzias latipes TaxID=8090 RepID=A0A3P9IB65_ORYLA
MQCCLPSRPRRRTRCWLPQTASLGRQLHSVRKMPKNQSRQADSQEANASNQREVLDAISALREELMTTIANTIKTHSDQLVELQGSLEKIECKIQDTTGRVTDLETAAAAHSDSIHAMQADMGAMKKELAFLKDRCEDLETRSRRCNLRIMGVKEGREDGSPTTQFVAELLAESLKLTSVPLLDRAHRSLRSKPSDGNAPPRAFVIKCHYFREKESILKKAAELKTITTKNGDRITILPDYTQTVSKQRAAFGEVRSLLRGLHRVRYGLLFPATLRITTPEGEEFRFKCPLEAKKFVTTKLKQQK